MTISVERARALLQQVEMGLRASAREPALASATASDSQDIASRIAVAAEERRQHNQRQLRLAYERLEAGEFGYCVSCGEDIDEARLEATPLVVVCAACMAARSH